MCLYSIFFQKEINIKESTITGTTKTDPFSMWTAFLYNTTVLLSQKMEQGGLVVLASFPTFNNLNTGKYESECSEKTELSSGCRYLTGFTFHHSWVGDKVTEQVADGCCVRFVSL